MGVFQINKNSNNSNSFNSNSFNSGETEPGRTFTVNVPVSLVGPDGDVFIGGVENLFGGKA